jgi:hypothetical protein
MTLEEIQPITAFTLDELKNLVRDTSYIALVDPVAIDFDAIGNIQCPGLNMVFIPAIHQDVPIRIFKII